MADYIRIEEFEKWFLTLKEVAGKDIKKELYREAYNAGESYLHVRLAQKYGSVLPFEVAAMVTYRQRIVQTLAKYAAAKALFDLLGIRVQKDEKGFSFLETLEEMLDRLNEDTSILLGDGQSGVLTWQLLDLADCDLNPSEYCQTIEVSSWMQTSCE